MIFHWNLSDNKSPQISRTLLHIQANFSNALVWMVSVFCLISYSPSLFSQPFGSLQNTPTTIGIINTHSSTVFSVLWQGLGIFLYFCLAIGLMSRVFADGMGDWGSKPYLPTPPLGQDMTQGQFFKRSPKLGFKTRPLA